MTSAVKTFTQGDINPEEFFVAGGTLRASAQSYVQRPADDELYFLTLARKFCYVLTPRQMGKSSLMVRTAQRLREAGVRTAIIDLTQIGTEISQEQWYLGLMTRLTGQLRLRQNLADWWRKHEALSAVQRFTSFLLEVVLAEGEAPVAIFVDEIDSTLRLPFSDDFFAAIRGVYNERATEPAFERLNFVLLGVATPTDLMKDRTRTPFNIGQRVELREFSRVDARILQAGLEALYPEGGATIFDRVLDWTNGHPYLTQKLCQRIAESEKETWTTTEVDDLVNRLFLSDEARRETNLQFVRDSIISSPQKVQLLRLYRRVLLGKAVKVDERSMLQNRLRLFGLVREEQGVLAVHNNIYREAFNEAWIDETLPVDWTRRIAIAAVAALLIIVPFSVYYILRFQQQADERLAQQAIAEFSQTSNAALRLASLDRLFNVSGYDEEARQLYREMTADERLELYSLETSDLTNQHLTVISGTYHIITDATMAVPLITAMVNRLGESPADDARLLTLMLNRWRNGLESYEGGDFARAVIAFDDALALDPRTPQPSIWYSRAMAHAAADDPDQALVDLETILSQNNLPEDVRRLWEATIAATLREQPALLAAWYRRQSDFLALAALPIPTPTQTPLPSATPLPTSTRPIVDACEPNDDLSTACLIGPGELRTGINMVPVSGEGPDVDFFQLPVKAGNFYRCRTLDLSPYHDTQLAFYDEQGNMVAFNDDYLPLDRSSEILYLADVDGWLYVEVSTIIPVALDTAELYTYSLECILDPHTYSNSNQYPNAKPHVQASNTYTDNVSDSRDRPYTYVCSHHTFSHNNPYGLLYDNPHATHPTYPMNKSPGDQTQAIMQALQGFTEAFWKHPWARYAVFGVLVIAVAAGVFLVIQRDGSAVSDPSADVTSRFTEANSAESRWQVLAGVSSDAPAVRKLIATLPTNEKLALFTTEREVEPEVVIDVARALYLVLPAGNEGRLLLAAMNDTMNEGGTASHRLLAFEMGHWLTGKIAYDAGDFAAAEAALTRAVEGNDANPAVYYDRALVRSRQENFDGAVDDLDTLMTLNLEADVVEDWTERVREILTDQVALLQAWAARPESGMTLGMLGLVENGQPVETATVTPTATPTVDPLSDVFENNNTAETSAVIGMDLFYDLNFVSGRPDETDRDYFRLWVKSGEWVTCETYNLSSVNDTQLTFYSGPDAETEIVSNDDKSQVDLGSEISYVATDTGWLYILVNPLVDIAAHNAVQYVYTLSCYLNILSTPMPSYTPTPDFRPSPSIPTPTPFGGTPGPTLTPSTTPPPSPTPTATATPIFYQYPEAFTRVDKESVVRGEVAGDVLAPGEIHQWTFTTVQARQTVTVSIGGGPNQDIVFTVIDPRGNILVAQDAAPVGEVESIKNLELPLAGVYELRVHSVGGVAGPYAFMVFEDESTFPELQGYLESDSFRGESRNAVLAAGAEHVWFVYTSFQSSLAIDLLASQNDASLQVMVADDEEYLIDDGGSYSLLPAAELVVIRVTSPEDEEVEYMISIVPAGNA